ncbi:MAG: 4'-phosphopantetheinyl transferase superfamily protein [Bacteroidota bacterium]
MDILIYKADTKALMQQQALPHLLHRLPTSLHPKALRYRSAQSSYNYIVGRLLLQCGLKHFGLDPDLERIAFLENGKPTLPDIHFNISHSAHLVVCGCSAQGDLGLDIEQLQPVDFDAFASFFSSQEWLTIKSAAHPMQCFYTFWTRKESIIKANGLTLNYLHQIELDITKDHFVAEGKKWFLQDLALQEDFAGAVCSEQQIQRIEVVDFEGL